MYPMPDPAVLDIRMPNGHRLAPILPSLDNILAFMYSVPSPFLIIAHLCGLFSPYVSPPIAIGTANNWRAQALSTIRIASLPTNVRFSLLQMKDEL
jgi:hypothetical protein